MLLKALGVIERVASKLAPGRTPHFLEAHIVKALRIIANEGPLGRVKLSRALGLGEGVIRTLIRHLVNEGLVETSRAGIALTQSGNNLSLALESTISETIEIPQSPLTIGPLNIAILVRNVADAIKGGVEQRDAAIKVGASGATTLVLKRGKLNMPFWNQDAFKEIPAIRESLISLLGPQENDVIIIGSAKDELTAELGAIAATLATLKVAGHGCQSG